MNPADEAAEIFEICDRALAEAPFRPLDENEIAALRYAAAIPAAKPAHHQPDLTFNF